MFKNEHQFVLKVPMISINVFRHGFTLIELITVLALISIVFVFTIPRFQNTLLSDNTRKVSQWIILSIPSIKVQAINEQKQYTLNMNIDTGEFWITNDAMTEEEIESVAERKFKCPPDVFITDVTFPEKPRITSGQAEIHFYSKGFSDKAIIHIGDNHDEERSFLIEPFLQHVKMIEGYMAFST